MYQIVITGAVLSMFNVARMVAFCPLRSVAVPVTIWPAASVLTVTLSVGTGPDPVSTVMLARPEPPSVAVNVTVTFVLFHPAAFGWWSSVAVITGGLSMFTVTDVVAEFPALSVAVPVITCP